MLQDIVDRRNAESLTVHSRLAFAKGASAVNSNKTADLVAELRKAAGPSGYDAVILCVGRAEAVRQGLELLRPKGRLVVFSAVTGQTPIDLFRLHVKELEILGACNDDNRFDAAVDRLSDASLGLGSLITHRFPIGEYRKAFEVAAEGHAQAMKVAIEFP